jgi:hypothetical protein
MQVVHNGLPIKKQIDFGQLQRREQDTAFFPNVPES